MNRLDEVSETIDNKLVNPCRGIRFAMCVPI